MRNTLGRNQKGLSQVIDRLDRRNGIAWESALTNGFAHDGSLESITHSNGFRDTTVSIGHPWHWDLRDASLPAPLTHEQVCNMRFVFKFQDVASFSLSHEQEQSEIRPVGGPSVMEYRSNLESDEVDRLSIYMYSEVDCDEAGMMEAGDTHGGVFRSALISVLGGCELRLVFRDCLCVPSDWAAYDAWIGYPFDGETQLPALRATGIATAGRFVEVGRRHVCTTRIVETSVGSPVVDVTYLCEDCIEEWEELYSPEFEIPRHATGEGELMSSPGNARRWERGSFPRKRCWCQVEELLGR